MPMFDDPQKELEQLQEKLLEQEEWFQRELDSAKRMIGDLPEERPARTKNAAAAKAAKKPSAGEAPVRNHANGYGTQPSRKIVQPLQQEDYDREELEPRKKSVKGLVILASLETLGILGLIGYWLLVLL